MTFDEYQTLALMSVRPTDKLGILTYVSLGLSADTGAIAREVESILLSEDHSHVEKGKHAEYLASKLKDILLYTAILCTELEISLEDIAKDSIGMIANRS